MKVNSLTDNGFVISNDCYKVECDFKTMSAAILKNGEVENYCALKFPHAWNESNLLQINDVARHKTLFEVDLKGNDVNEWIKQLMKAFADYLKDDLIIGNYNISGIEIPLIL
jgi:hypothetical protein